MARRIRFFPDFGAIDPVWDESGVGITLETLQLSAETKNAVREWCSRWEALARRQLQAEDSAAGMTPEEGEHVGDERWDALDAEGRRLSDRLQQELGVAFEIVYEGTR